jgi:predicted PurR-regulated permease PerM
MAEIRSRRSITAGQRPPMRRLPWPLVFQVVGVIAAVWLVVHVWQLVMLIFTAVIVAAAVLPAARVAERYRVPRGVTVLGVYVGVAGLFALMGRLLWPALREQGLQLMENFPRYVDNVRGWIGILDVFLVQWGASVPVPRPEQLQGMAGALVANTFAVTAGAFGFVVGLLLILVIAAYLVTDARRVGDTLLALLPPEYRPRAARLAGPVLERIGGYVRGQLISSLVVGAVLAVGLALLGVRYALLIGALAAVLNVVPFVGSLVAAVLGILSALNESIGLAAATALLFWGTNLLEGKLLAPHFVGRATGLHPLTVLLALFVGAHLAGLIGALVAVPFVAAMWEIVRQLYIRPLDRPAERLTPTALPPTSL